RNDLQKSLDYARAMAMTNKTGAQVCVADGTITISNARKAEKIITGGSGGSVQYGFKYDWEVASKLSSKEYKAIGSNGLDSGCVVFAYNGSIPEIAKKAPKSPKPPLSSEGKCDTSSSPPPYVNKDGFFGRSDGSADPEWELIFNGAGFYVVRKPGGADFT
ncbi:prepilin-type cleavage/methylation domain-containing protein, partial [Pseudomonas aeruginosa]|nr:prepilin-type cleavage/methylation domain-containing protein [Pseudomonas aeruginosa]